MRSSRFAKEPAKERDSVGNVRSGPLHAVREAADLRLVKALFLVVDIVRVVEVELQSFSDRCADAIEPVQAVSSQDAFEIGFL